MHYRRSDAQGGTFFFTVNLANRGSQLLTEEIDLLRCSVRKVKQDHPFQIIAMVVLPEHLHAIWRMPEGDCDYPKRWALIKAGFSRGLKKVEFISKSRTLKRERGIWQRRFWEHQIRDDDDYYRHVDYIHFNPVRHGYVHMPIDWQYSSIHQYIRQGILPRDWADCRNGATDGFGECR